MSYNYHINHFAEGSGNMGISSDFPIWDKLTSQQKELIEKSAVKRFAPKGTLLHNGSADCVGLFVIHSGRLRAFIISDEGKEVTLYRLFEHDICLFSASCIMENIQFDVTVEAEKDTELWIIPTNTYKQIVENSAVVANYTNKIMASRFSEVMWLIEQVMWKSFDKRLSAFLLKESDIEQSDSLKITHEVISHHMGTAREVVTRMLRYFQSEGMVHLTRGGILIKDRKKLEKLAEE
jgi:CRP/FNR family transcriptional regulator